MELWAVNEWDKLRKVVVGTAESMGGIPSLADAYDPKSKMHISAGSFPTESACARELEGLVALLESCDIEVLRPHVIPDLNQIFSRDVGVVVGDQIVVSRMISDRAEEWEGIAPLLEQVPAHKQLNPPPGVRIEGGDVMPVDGEIWVGYSAQEDFEQFTTARTNESALDWLADQFPDWNVRGFQLTKSDDDPFANALHLDCCFSMFSKGHALFHPEGLKLESDRRWIRERFPERLLELDARAMCDMQCNLISISPDEVMSCPSFNEVNTQLESWGYSVLSTPLQETSKMEGLLRCVTLPIKRQA